MNKLLAIAGAISVAALVSISAVTSSSAHPWNPVGAGLVGGLLGFAAGAAVANSYDGGGYGYGYDDGGYGWHRHVRECFRAYGRAYNPRSDAYLGEDGYDHLCRL
jgi:hypothetical protein